jgi:predicted dehydrogenase
MSMTVVPVQVRDHSNDDSAAIPKKAGIAVIGVGWWSQGWHLPHLSRNKDKVRIVAVVDRISHPQSSLNPNLESLDAVSQKYQCPRFFSVENMLQALGDDAIDGAIICTPHATHYETALLLHAVGERRGRPLFIFMEKPMTTSVTQAMALHQLDSRNKSIMVNHSANYRIQARLAREAVASASLGTVRHISASMACPLTSLFDNPANTGWVLPDKSGDMLGNGFAWGQSCHLLGWIYHVCGGGSAAGDSLVPKTVHCSMTHSEKTGADVSFSATVVCENGANISVSGTSLLPGYEHSDPPVSKHIQIAIYGTEGALLYGGKDRDADSGRLELLRTNGESTQVVLHPNFHFENTQVEGSGPESLLNFIAKCCGNQDFHVGADTLVGLRTVQTVEAMYRSNMTGNVVHVL